MDESDHDAGFNWGYDPLNYNIPEGSYSTDPHHGEVRVREFKQLIQAAHERGIGIIMDVVYNHTYATEDSPFNKTYRGTITATTRTAVCRTAPHAEMNLRASV